MATSRSGVHANQFASDLFLALDRSLNNLEPVERSEAWGVVADVITSGSRTDASYLEFCVAVASRFTELAGVANRPSNPRGMIKPQCQLVIERHRKTKVSSHPLLHTLASVPGFFPDYVFRYLNPKSNRGNYSWPPGANQRWTAIKVPLGVLWPP
jgi:hypothetical protein